ncbi:MAG: hypothetical protein ACFCU3_03500 [Verrucomicrobiales bacterium]
MPLTDLQKSVLAAIWKNRSETSHLAGAAAIQASPSSIRYSKDLDPFHDTEMAVAEAFEKDRAALQSEHFSLQTLLSQPGFIRAQVSRADQGVLIDWAHDSAWRFMPTISLEGIGHVLHPVDLAVNKVLALGGREEPRDWVDILYLDKNFISLGAMVWAAVGKDPGMNPDLLLGLLSRKGKIQQRDLDRLILTPDVRLDDLHAQWAKSLATAKMFARSRPASEAGRLYVDPRSGRFFAPGEDDEYQLCEPRAGGGLPRMSELEDSMFRESIRGSQDLQQFFGIRLST